MYFLMITILKLLQIKITSNDLTAVLKNIRSKNFGELLKKFQKSFYFKLGLLKCLEKLNQIFVKLSLMERRKPKTANNLFNPFNISAA